MAPEWVDCLFASKHRSRIRDKFWPWLNFRSYCRGYSPTVNQGEIARRKAQLDFWNKNLWTGLDRAD
jgi:hypothetical protein